MVSHGLPAIPHHVLHAMLGVEKKRRGLHSPMKERPHTRLLLVMTWPLSHHDAKVHVNLPDVAEVSQLLTYAPEPRMRMHTFALHPKADLGMACDPSGTAAMLTSPYGVCVTWNDKPAIWLGAGAGAAACAPTGIAKRTATAPTMTARARRTIINLLNILRGEQRTTCRGSIAAEVGRISNAHTDTN
jgi:hypothetical protein